MADRCVLLFGGQSQRRCGRLSAWKASCSLQFQCNQIPTTRQTRRKSPLQILIISGCKRQLDCIDNHGAFSAAAHISLLVINQDWTACSAARKPPWGTCLHPVSMVHPCVHALIVAGCYLLLVASCYSLLAATCCWLAGPPPLAGWAASLQIPGEAHLQELLRGDAVRNVHILEGTKEGLSTLLDATAD